MLTTTFVTEYYNDNIKSATNPLIQLVVTVVALVVGGVEAHGGAGDPHTLSNGAGGGQHEEGRHHNAHQHQCHV